MALGTIERRLLQRFADLLEYPRPGLVEVARECEGLAPLVAPSPVSGEGGAGDAAALLQAFRTYSETAPLGRLEELYSSTFDLGATCHPYVGYHLLGESYKRSVFLLELKACYRAQGFEVPENELPDHLAVMLRFLAANDDSTLAAELVHEALLPAIDRMTGRVKSEGYDEERASMPLESPKPDHPYRQVLEALQLVLQEIPTSGMAAGNPQSAVV